MADLTKFETGGLSLGNPRKRKAEEIEKGKGRLMGSSPMVGPSSTRMVRQEIRAEGQEPSPEPAICKQYLFLWMPWTKLTNAVSCFQHGLECMWTRGGKARACDFCFSSKRKCVMAGSDDATSDDDESTYKNLKQRKGETSRKGLADSELVDAVRKLTEAVLDQSKNQWKTLDQILKEVREVWMVQEMKERIVRRPMEKKVDKVKEEVEEVVELLDDSD